MPRPPRKKVPLQPAGPRANQTAATPVAKPAHRPNTKTTTIATKAANIKSVRATPQPKKNNARGLPSSLPPSAMKVQHTPSFMSFTQRPRQGSILRMVQGENGDEDEGETTYFSLDLDRSLSPESAKKRKSTEGQEEESSSAQKRRRSSRRRTETIVDIDVRRVSARSARASAASEPAQDENENEDEEEEANATEVQVPATNPEEETTPQPMPDIDRLLAVNEAEPSSIQEPEQEQEQSPSLSPVPTNLSSERDLTLDLAAATPSSPGSTYIAAAFTSARRTGTRTRKQLAHQLGKRLPRGTNLPIQRAVTPPASEPDEEEEADAPSPVSSPLSSPTSKAATRRGNTKPKGRTRAQQERFMRTADLTALLPRRRGKGRYSEFDILGSDDIPVDEHDDSGAEEYGRRRGARSRAKTGRTAKAVKTGTTASAKKTYSRRDAEAESESEDGEDDTAGHEDDETTLVGEKSMELEDAVKKFAAVDEWELSFESCDVGGEESSPWR